MYILQIPKVHPNVGKIQHTMYIYKRMICSMISEFLEIDKNTFLGLYDLKVKALALNTPDA